MSNDRNQNEKVTSTRFNDIDATYRKDDETTEENEASLKEIILISLILTGMFLIFLGLFLIIFNK